MTEPEKRMCCYLGRDGEGKPFGDHLGSVQVHEVFVDEKMLAGRELLHFFSEITGARECGREADFEIQNTTPGADIYDVTDACLKHVGQMLGSGSTDKEGHTAEATQWRIVFIGKPGTQRPF